MTSFNATLIASGNVPYYLVKKEHVRAKLHTSFLIAAQINYLITGYGFFVQVF